MAWVEQCKIEACCSIEKRKEIAGSVNKAIKEISKESEIPFSTLERWFYPSSLKNEGKKNKQNSEVNELVLEQRLWYSLPKKFSNLIDLISIKGRFPPSEQIRGKTIQKAIKQYKALCSIMDQLIATGGSQ